MLTDSTPTSIVVKANLYTASIEEQERRELAIRNKDFYYGNQKKYINKVNDDVDYVTVNLTKPIVKKKVNLLYSRKLKRVFKGPAASTSFIKKTYEDLDIDCILNNVDLHSELTGTTLVHVGLSDEGNITLLTFDASDFTVVSEGPDKTNIDALSLVSTEMQLKGTTKVPQVMTVLKTQIWTNEWITTYETGTKIQELPNELGYIPFVAFKGEEVNSQYLGHAPANDIQLINSTINEQLTNLGYMIKMQSATPVVITGFDRGEGVVIHPGKAISLPNGATANVLQTDPKIDETLNEIKYLEEKLYETTGVPKVSVVGDVTANSGRELLIRWYPIIQVFKEKALRYEKYELALANMILKVKGLEPIKSVNVEWAEENLLPIHSDTDNMEELFKWGITTPADIAQRRDPSLSDNEADVLINTNIEFNTSINKTDVKTDDVDDAQPKDEEIIQ